jgi:cob(I)alamin adenosyltransferase
MKIYTKTGDDGTTGLFGGPRVPKDHPRIAAYGTVDELNAVIGIVRSFSSEADWEPILKTVQDSLFAIGAELATPVPEEFQLKWQGTAYIELLEKAIDEMEARLPPLKNFILPAGSQTATFIHLARTVCRRAEREIVTLGSDPSVSDVSMIVVYLNRLSDYLFVTAREANRILGKTDVPWQSPREKQVQ